MAKPKIDAKQALDDISSGMDDQALMDKYSISSKGLQSLYRKLVSAGAITQEDIDLRTSASFGNVSITTNVREPPRPARKKTEGRLVSAHGAVKDIKSNMNDADLMEKYRLSSKGLQSLFAQLVDSGVVSQIELDRRMPWTDSTVDVLGILRQFGLDRSFADERKDSGVPSHCVACGAPQTMEFEVCPSCNANIPEFKAKMAEREVGGKLAWVCPACRRSQDKEYDECPVCGVIVSKYNDNNPT